MSNVSKLNINGTTYDLMDRNRRSIYVGTCATAAATAAKVATTELFPLDSEGNPEVGTLVAIKFTYTDACTTLPTLNVNDTGAFPYMYAGGTVPTKASSTYTGVAGYYIYYMFNGTHWVWVNRGNFLSNTDNAPGRMYSSAYMTGSISSFQYVLAMMTEAGRIESIVTSQTTASTKTRNTHGFRLGNVYYNPSGTIAANTVISSNYLWMIYSGGYIDFRYSSNCSTTLSAHNQIYLVGTIGTDGLFYLDETWWTQTLPTTEDGKVYIHIGCAYNTYRFIHNGGMNAWEYRDGAIRPYCNTYTKDEVDTVLNGKLDTLTFDSTPTSGSSNPVTSGGIYTALENKADLNGDITEDFSANNSKMKTLTILDNTDYEAIAVTATYDDSYTQLIINNDLSFILSYNFDNHSDDEPNREIIPGNRVTRYRVYNKVPITGTYPVQYTYTKLDAYDTEEEALAAIDSLTSGGYTVGTYYYTTEIVYQIHRGDYYTISEVDDLLDTKQNTLTFDASPISGSIHPVTSGGIYTSLQGKQDTISDLDTIRSNAALGATALQSYTETDPTVPSWAKASTKPTYTASEISGLATIATSGSYNDLSNTPTIPDSYTKTESDAKYALINGSTTLDFALKNGNAYTIALRNPLIETSTITMQRYSDSGIQFTDSNSNVLQYIYDSNYGTTLNIATQEWVAYSYLPNKVTVSSTGDVTLNLTTNKFYIFGTLTSLTITLTEPTDPILGIYGGKFTAGVDNMSITLPSGVILLDGIVDIVAGGVYEFNIMENVFLMIKVQ